MSAFCDKINKADIYCLLHNMSFAYDNLLQGGTVSMKYDFTCILEVIIMKNEGCNL